MFTPPLPPEQPSPSGILKLNVGGKKFATTYLTVSNINGMLSAMFSGRHTQIPDAEGYHFIDRDGTHFRHILNLLRFPTEFNIRLSEGDLIELEMEVRYYGLSEAYALARGDSGVPLPIISATSAGYDMHTRDPPNFKSYFTVGDVVLPASNRGWNVLLVDPKSNAVISQTSYDTHADARSVPRCLAFLNAVPEGTIVAIAVFDEGSGNNTSSMGHTLLLLGGSGYCIDGNPHGEYSIAYRASFAMVGCKGDCRGMAAEAYNAGGFVVTATRPTTATNKW
mmetsp:Transcript_16130/g.35197  ORF Transcript_16130/g.35197 Transcript_16130/m.35197 type:complete len:280 (-) Transcript_16130:286-1125(-)